MASSSLRIVSHSKVPRFRKYHEVADSLIQGWANPDTFPADKTDFTDGINPGQDVIIGQSVKGAIEEDDKLLYTCVYDGNKVHNKVTFEPFIQSNGGDYFFTPSLKLLGDLSVAQAV